MERFTRMFANSWSAMTLQPENALPLAQEMLTDRSVAIKVIGIGGAGANAVDRLKMENLDRVALAVLNTDAEALALSPVETKLMIGAGVTRGLSAGGDPELGRLAAEADREKIAALVARTDLVFPVAGMGGGTGSGERARRRRDLPTGRRARDRVCQPAVQLRGRPPPQGKAEEGLAEPAAAATP